MATVVNAIVAHPKANSFVPVDEVNEFMLALDPNWVNISPSEIARHVVMTAAKINAVRFLGQPYFPNQGMAFPRKNDARVRSTPVTGLSGVDAGTATEEHVPSATGSGCQFYTENFPVAKATNTVECTVSGQSVVLLDNGAGVLSDGTRTGTIDYTNGIVTLDFLVDTGTSARITASWYSSTKVASTSLVFDAESYLPGHLNGGSVHVPHPDGLRDYCAIVDHNIVTGVVTLGSRMTAFNPAGALLFNPYPRAVRDAQLIQLQAERGLLDWDRNANRGISTVKIGDTSRSYNTSSIPDKSKMLAGKYRVHELVIALLGPFTIYGKMGVVMGEWDASSTATS